MILATKRVPVLASLLFALVIATSVLLAGDSPPETEDPGEAMQERIRELRVAADYFGAAEVARQFAAHLRERGDALPFEIEEADFQASLLDDLASRPEEDRKALAEADRLEYETRAAYVAGGQEVCLEKAGRSLEIRRSVLGDQHHDIAMSLGQMANAYLQGRKLEEAKPLYEEALIIHRKIYGDESPFVATTLRNLANACYHSDDLIRAERCMRQVVDIVEATYGGESPELADELYLLSMIAGYQGDLAEATELAERALEIRRRALGEDHPLYAASVNRRALLLSRRGDNEGAEKFFREALSLRRKALGEEHRHTLNTLCNLGSHLVVSGDYVAAEPILREALAIRRRVFGGDSYDVAESLLSLGQLFLDRRDFATAETFLREALRINREVYGDDHSEVSTAVNNLAVALSGSGNHEEAEALFREALAISERAYGKGHPETATELGNLAAALGDRGQYAEAESLARESLEIRRRKYGDEHPRVARSLAKIADIQLQAGDLDGAERTLQEEIAMTRKTLGEDHPRMAITLTELGEVRRALGDYEGAEGALEEAVVAYETARARVGEGTARATFSDSPYPFLAATRLDLGKEDDAWPAYEKSLGGVLADMLDVAGTRRLTEEEEAREDSLRLALGDAEGARDAFRELAESDETGEAARRAVEIENRLLALETEWAAFRKELTEKYPVAMGSASSLEEVQSALEPRTALIGWLDVKERDGSLSSWGYSIAKEGPVRWTSLGRSDDTTPFDRCASFRTALADPRSPQVGVDRDGRALWEERVQPIAVSLENVNELVVIPSGAMLGVPVEALVDDRGVPLDQRFAVTYVPSATIHTWLHERDPVAAASRTLLVGDPPYNEIQLAAMEREAEEGEDVLLAAAEPTSGTLLFRSMLSGDREALGSLPRLPGSRREVLRLSSAVSEPSVLLGPGASEQELVRLARDGGLSDLGTIHIATHALVDDDFPENSALVLSQIGLPDPLEAARSGERIYDGLLTAKEIVREWELNADLVTLSACETGLGKTVRGEGYIGFAHAFFQAGARSMLVSLWKVEDEATALLMERFYRNRAGGAMTKAEALREAKLWLREQTDEQGNQPYAHPYYWSAFVLIGDRR